MSETDVLQKEKVETDASTVVATNAETDTATVVATETETDNGADAEAPDVTDVAEADNAEINTPWYYNTRTWILIFVTGIALYWIITGIMGM